MSERPIEELLRNSSMASVCLTGKTFKLDLSGEIRAQPWARPLDVGPPTCVRKRANTWGLTRDPFKTIVVPFWLEMEMPTTLTLKNIPDDVYARLKTSAEAHRRSMNSEAIVCLEAMLLPAKVAPTERLARARALRDTLPQGKFRVRDIDALKREGRQ